MKQGRPLPKKPGPANIRPGSLCLIAACFAALALSAGFARAEGRWQEAAFGAIAILPPPIGASQVAGGSLACAEQQWNFRLRIDALADIVVSKDVKLVIGEEKFPTPSSRAGSYLTIAVPPDALEPLKTGSRFGVTDSVDARRIAAFGLDGSRKAIEAVAPRCSQVDMSSYEAVMFSETDRSVETARTLLAGEISLFRAATAKLPTLGATMIDVDGGMLLFAKLCGSNSYYGKSGCNLTGFSSKGETDAWEEVYNTDGLLLYTDPKALANGWPDLLTLPMSGGSEVSRWRWNGRAFAVTDPIVAEDPAYLGDGNPQRTRLDGTTPEAFSGGGTSFRPTNRKTLTPG